MLADAVTTRRPRRRFRQKRYWCRHVFSLKAHDGEQACARAREACPFPLPRYRPLKRYATRPPEMRAELLGRPDVMNSKADVLDALWRHAIGLFSILDQLVTKNATVAGRARIADEESHYAPRLIGRRH